MSMTLDWGLHRAMLLPAMISSSQCVHLEHPGNNIAGPDNNSDPQCLVPGASLCPQLGTIIARHALIQNLEEYWKSDEQLHLPWESGSFEWNKLTRKSFTRLASGSAYCQHAASCRYCQSSVTPMSQFVVSRVTSVSAELHRPGHLGIDITSFCSS